MTDRFRLPESDKLEERWNNFRATSPVFTEAERKVQETLKGNIDEWGFCISEILPCDSNSIFFLGINPSAPPNELHTSFGINELTKGTFKYQREIAQKLGLKFAYWDLFPVRMTDQEKTKKKFEEIWKSEQGRDIIRDMLELARQAIETVKPKAVCVCNRVIRDMATGTAQGPLASIWKEANILPLSHRESCEMSLPTPDGTKKFYSNAMVLDGTPIPVFLGGHLGAGWHRGPEQAAFIVEVLKKPLAHSDNPSTVA